jgi:hypothetical protein
MKASGGNVQIVRRLERACSTLPALGGAQKGQKGGKKKEKVPEKVSMRMQPSTARQHDVIID